MNNQDNQFRVIIPSADDKIIVCDGENHFVNDVYLEPCPDNGLGAKMID